MKNLQLFEADKSNLVVAAQSIPALLGAKNGAHYPGQALLAHAQAVALFPQAEGVNQRLAAASDHLWEGLALSPLFQLMHRGAAQDAEKKQTCREDHKPRQDERDRPDKSAKQYPENPVYPV